MAVRRLRTPRPHGTVRSVRSVPLRPARCQGSGPARPRSAQEEPGQARGGGAVRAVEAVLQGVQLGEGQQPIWAGFSAFNLSIDLQSTLQYRYQPLSGMSLREL